MLLLYFGAALLLGCSQVHAWRRADIGLDVSQYDIFYQRHINENDLPTVTEIQADQYAEGLILVAIGNFIYAMDEYGDAARLVGNPNVEGGGYADGKGEDALFNRISGFAQLTDRYMIISDENNQCIRQYDRLLDEVVPYAGRCNVSYYYGPDEYELMQTFNKPSKIVHDSHSGLTFILDMMIPNQKYVILSSYPTGFESKVVIHTHGDVVNSFTYDGISNSYAIAKTNEVENFFADGSLSTSKIAIADAFGLALFDDILIVANTGSGMVDFIDFRWDSNFTICNDSYAYEFGLPSCTLVRPTAVAVINGYLYIGSDYQGSSSKARITKISFTTPGTQKRTTTGSYSTPAPWDPWSPWSPEPDPWTPPTAAPYDPWTDDYDYDDDDYGISGGTLALIIIGCILGLGLKVSLITWRVRRYTYRVRMRRVAVATTAVTVQRSNVPYGRLREQPPPVTGSFPTPPPYSASSSTPHSAPPPAYSSSKSVMSNPPPASPSTARY